MTNFRFTRRCAILMLAVAPLAAQAQILGPAPQPATGTAAPRTAAANWRDVLSSLKMSPRGELVSKRHHAEVAATTADGRAVIVSFDPAGRLWEVEAEEHDRYRHGDGPVDPQAAVEAARRAGFSGPALQEVKRNHTVVRARTDKAELVELHVDRGGFIYKQVWVR